MRIALLVVVTLCIFRVKFHLDPVAAGYGPFLVTGSMSPERLNHAPNSPDAFAWLARPQWRNPSEA